MLINDVSTSLCKFNKVVTHLPESELKQSLKHYVDDITKTILKAQLKRNQTRNFQLTSPRKNTIFNKDKIHEDFS